MRALVSRGSGIKAFVDRPMPSVQASGDALVRMHKTSISEADLSILRGEIAGSVPGRILGHEGIGVIEAVGTGVKNFAPGQRVLISRVSACGNCRACRLNLAAHCASGGWLLGNEIDGTHAEYVRVPHADGSLHLLRAGDNETGIVLLSDLFPTAFERGLGSGLLGLSGTLVIIGCGPLGLAALMLARMVSPLTIIAIDADPYRRRVADKLGATHSVAPDDRFLMEVCRRYTPDGGGDYVIETTGSGTGFGLAQDLVAPGGTIALAGLYAAKADFHLERHWSRNVHIVSGLPSASSTAGLLMSLQAGKLDPSSLVTHRFHFDKIMSAYDTMASAAQNHALKVLVELA